MCWDILEPSDWKYFRWHPKAGVDMREVAPGLYEQWIVKLPDSTYQAIFHTFPELTEYNMRDLYTRHPDPNKKDYWSPSGRSDDIIVLGNGEKIQPLDMESLINSHTGVTGSLVVSLPAVFKEKMTRILTITCRLDLGSSKQQPSSR